MAILRFLLLTTVVAIGFFKDSEAYKPCIVPKPADTDESWFIEAAEKGFHVAEHSNCDNCEKEEAWSWLKGSGRSSTNKMCWVMEINTHFGKYTLPYTCKYSKISREECELDTSNSNINDKLKMGGKIILTHTDNSTYVAGTLCVFGKENLWWILTTNEDKTLPDGVLEDIKNDYHEMGFKKGNVAKAGKSAVYVTQMSASPKNC